jgi:phosphoenolpyruvate---glycerone phosphotransferase subunit DhaL
MEIGTPELDRFLRLFAERLKERKGELTELDARIGDADHGINMDRGFTAVVGKLNGPDGEATPGALARLVGMTLISTVGGASGPLYGTFFLRLAGALGEQATVTPQELGQALRAAVEGVAQRGKAEQDDKTMVDAMRPAVEAYESSIGEGMSVALGAAAAAAAAGRDRITPLVARKGRASYLGERSAGHQDPGATSTTMLFEALRDALAGPEPGSQKIGS